MVHISVKVSTNEKRAFTYLADFLSNFVQKCNLVHIGGIYICYGISDVIDVAH